MRNITSVLIIGCCCLLAACETARSPPLAADSVSPQAHSAQQWVPAVGDTWQWQLSGALNISYAVTVYDVDLFDTPQSVIDMLKAKGRRVVCYFSAGSAEAWRPDFGQFAVSDMGAPLEGWAGEYWVDTRSDNVRRIMGLRLDLARDKGCDAVEPDNVDAYTNRSGFELNSDMQLDFNRFLAKEAHARHLRVGLKNDLAQVSELAPYFDFAVNEQCFEYDECAAYSAFTNSGKPVYSAEYARRYQKNTNGARDALCKAARGARIQTLVLSVDLDDSVRHACADV